MKKLFVIFLLLVPYILLGQEKCGTDAILEQQLQDPKFARSFAKLEKRVQDLQKSKSVFNPITVPVIVHIIHEGEPYGTGNHFTTEFVEETINNLSQNFAGEFSDDPTANTQISFCIANNSVNGDPIDGIRYYNWDDFNFGYDINIFENSTTNSITLANTIGYDRSNYCNIYVLDWGGGTLGFAYTPPSNYGIYMNSPFFGLNDNFSYGLNRTLVHEAGHYCGLYHTFHLTQDCDLETNCNSQGDRVCDTPVTTGNYGCPTNGGACGNDLVENYMDYTNDVCMNSFTQGQTLRMLSSLETLRPGVVANTFACGATNGIDISLNGLLVPVEGCNEVVEDVTVQLNNFGDTITELELSYNINGIIEVLPWTGNLGFGDSEIITLPSVNVGFGEVQIEVEALIENDLNYENNIATYEFDNFDGVNIDVQINFDALPSGFDWKLYEAENGEPIGEPIFEANYDAISSNNLYSCESLTYNFCLEEGEYVIVLTDLFGNGFNYPYCDGNDQAGNLTILNLNDTLNYISGNWGSNIDLPFTVSAPCLPLGNCPWDINDDGIVNVPDILFVLENFTLEENCHPADFNQNGVVDVDDVLDIISYFGYYCSGGMVENDINKSSIDYYIYQAGGKITHSELYDLQGRKVNKDKIYLPEGIYVVKQYWDNGFITTKKLYLNPVK